MEIPFFERTGLAFSLVTPGSENGWRTINVMQNQQTVTNSFILFQIPYFPKFDLLLCHFLFESTCNTQKQPNGANLLSPLYLCEYEY